MSVITASLPLKSELAFFLRMQATARLKLLAAAATASELLQREEDAEYTYVMILHKYAM